jgi:hypothetical protein
MGIQIIGNDIEIDGEKVARILDIRASLRHTLEDYVDRADGAKDSDKLISKLEDELKQANEEIEEAKEKEEEIYSQGYSEGKNDANSN